ncbi:putative hydrolase of the HAD superfamily [Ruminococcaceae bacterium FB2012]|nr:putative hydrolase of the HAD superfamily [Ruminococcaceae bacterium FB2012]
MNIIFDIGKVLIDFDFEDHVGKLFDRETADAVIAATWHSPDWTELDRGVLSDEQVLRRFISNAPGYEREIREVFAKLGTIPKLRPTTIPMIKSLKAEGHKVYYLSNYFSYLMHTAPWVLDFIRYTDGGVFSCFEHVTKPAPEIYQILCDRYSLKKEESVFIDDSLPNIKGSEDFGIRAIHYTGQTPEELHREIVEG